MAAVEPNRSVRDVSRRRSVIAVIAAFLAILTGMTIGPLGATGPAQATQGSDFNPGYIISDANFFNGGAMSSGDIQGFLQSKEPSCAAGYTCLKDYRQDTPSMAADAMCGAYQGASGESAAQIIAKVGQSCGISPRVLIVLLEKEQSLVSDTSPTQRQYNAATGYSCPDTAACDPNYATFFVQVYHAAWQFKRYANPPGTSNYFNWYPIGKVSQVAFNPNSACGSAPVTIQNQATADLYYYTPYQPNAAALANLYGVGDACSAYGNRNFWRLYSDWFGSPIGGAVPIGGMDVGTASTGQIQINGWAIDPDTLGPVEIDVYVDGQGAAIGTANASRPDVGAAYPGYGNNHGIDMQVTASTGVHQVCAWAINVLGGVGNTLLGCAQATANNRNPIGGMNVVTAPHSGDVTIQGWTMDPDDLSKPLQVAVYSDGVGVAIGTANATRTDVGRVYPGSGDNHGIDLAAAVGGGTHQVCAYGLNIGIGVNSLLGCQTVTVDGTSPYGGMNVVLQGGTSAVVNGWVIDPDTTDPVNVAVYIDGVGVVASASADASRPDVGRAVPGAGDDHGLNIPISIDSGTHTVCAYGLNVGPGSNSLLGCQTVTLRAPIGGMNVVLPANGFTATINGWAIDQDTTDPISIAVYVDGVGVASQTPANASRPDVGRAYPGYGDNHGINTTVTLTSGSHQVCVYGLNAGPGGNSLLGCQTVTINSPIGGMNVVVGSVAGTSVVNGWAIDQDTTSPISVAVYIDGQGAVPGALANASRPDVGAVYPGFGDNHGIDIPLTTSSGSHQICAYGLNVGPGGNSLLGCQIVAVK